MFSIYDIHNTTQLRAVIRIIEQKLYNIFLYVAFSIIIWFLAETSFLIKFKYIICNVQKLKTCQNERFDSSWVYLYIKKCFLNEDCNSSVSYYF